MENYGEDIKILRHGGEGEEKELLDMLFEIPIKN